MTKTKEYFILSFVAEATKKAGKLTSRTKFCHYWQAGKYGAIMLVCPENKPMYQFREQVLADAHDLKKRIKSAVLIDSGRARFDGTDEEFAAQFSIDKLKAILHCAEEDDMFSLTKADIRELENENKETEEKSWEEAVEAAFYASHKKKDALDAVAEAVDEMVEATKEEPVSINKSEISVVERAKSSTTENKEIVDETGQMRFF